MALRQKGTDALTCPPKIDGYYYYIQIILLQTNIPIRLLTWILTILCAAVFILLIFLFKGVKHKERDTVRVQGMPWDETYSVITL